MNQLTAPIAARLAALVAALIAARPATADELYVASPTTFILQGSPFASDFALIGACGGDAHSIVLIGHDQFIGDSAGRIYIRNASTGQLAYAYDVPNDARALATDAGNLLAGGSNSSIVRVDTSNGAILATFTVPFPVTALLVHGSTLYVGSSFGQVYRGDVNTGGFQFWGTCSAPVNSLAIDTDDLILGTSAGIYRINLATQALDGSFAAPNDATSIALHLGDLLIGGSDATVVRVDRFSGAKKATLNAGVPVGALAIDDAGEPGSVFCFGVACPCGNDDPNGGCRNSSGFGARLTGSGSASASADDLSITAFQLPANRLGRFYMAAITNHVPFGAGLLCVGAGGYPTFRFPVESSGATGSFALSGVVAYANAHFPPSGHVLAGTTWNFQAWARDPAGPCSSTFNTTNAYAVTFVP